MKNEQPKLRWRRIIGILILLVAAGEGISQALIYKWAGTPYRTLSLYRFSPYGLARNNPDTTSPGFQINPNGFRNVGTYSRQKPENTLRVLMLGGSTLYSVSGETVPEGEGRVDSSSTIAQYLEQILEADPALGSLDVEVINAAVNFNRIVEVSVGYVTEWAYWDSDVVVVMGSANNFTFPPRGEIEARRFMIQAPHPWAMEFERRVNRHDFYSFVEKSVLTLEHYFASAALAKKLSEKIIQVAFTESADVSRRFGFTATTSSQPLADFEEYDLYIDEYLNYADAMVSVAKRRGQRMGFFWEYFLAHLGGLKPLSPYENSVYQTLGPRRTPEDRAFDFYARDKVAAYCQENGLDFVDVLPSLRSHEETVYADFLHYTREGNRFMARGIYEQMKPQFHRAAKVLLEDEVP